VLLNTVYRDVDTNFQFRDKIGLMLAKLFKMLL